jgi:hypothetical protein
MKIYPLNLLDRSNEADTSVSTVPHSVLIIFLQCVCITNLGLFDHVKCMCAMQLERIVHALAAD